MKAKSPVRKEEDKAADFGAPQNALLMISGRGSNVVMHQLQSIAPKLLTGVAAAAMMCTIAGCGRGITEIDEQYVAASLPPQFESLRMYSAAPVRFGAVDPNAQSGGHWRQGCRATIRDSAGPVDETVILDDNAGPSFDLDVTRTSSGWSVKSDGSEALKRDPNAFRAQFISCVGAIEDKYRSEPEKVNDSK
jgi:hypothetical protein